VGWLRHPHQFYFRSCTQISDREAVIPTLSNKWQCKLQQCKPRAPNHDSNYFLFAIIKSLDWSVPWHYSWRQAIILSIGPYCLGIP